MYKNYHKKIEEIFNYSANSSLTKEIISRGFCYSEFQAKKALFIGINPSYLSNSKPEKFHYSIEKAVKDYKKHFGKFQDLVENTKYEDDWTYIDLFFFRETSQNKITEIINHDIDFIINQLQLTNEIISEIRPEIIVVCNSGASNFFGINSKNDQDIWLGYKFEFDDEFGVDIITGMEDVSIIKDKNNLNLIGTPILFSTTLTYLDAFTKRRLKWIINRVGKNKTFMNEKYK